MTSNTLESIRTRIKRLMARNRSKVTLARYDTSDVVQETWIQVWKQLAKHGEGSSEAISDAQIACYAKGHAAKMYRKHTAWKRDVLRDVRGSKLHEVSGKNDPFVEVEIQDQFEVLCQAIDELQPASQAFIICYFFEQLSLQQVGEELDMSIDKVRGLKKQVIRDLRVRMARKTAAID